MSRKIATPAAVFAACETLEEAGKPWNRDDVRYAVGGGGYNVIDPLIQAWRKIKPIKAIAPSTPTDLLHVIAESIESHLAQYITDVEERDSERAKAFENGTLGLSNKISEFESQIQQYEAQLAVAEDDNIHLKSTIEQQSEKITHLNQVNAKYLTDSDELRGNVQRIQAQLEEEKSSYKLEVARITDDHNEQIKSIKRDYQQQLSIQKQELTKSNEQSENRLMRLIEQERSSSRQQIKEQQKKLDEAIQSRAKLSEQNSMLIANEKRMQIEINTLKSEITNNEKSLEMDELTSTLKMLTKKIGDLEHTES